MRNLLTFLIALGGGGLWDVRASARRVHYWWRVYLSWVYYNASHSDIPISGAIIDIDRNTDMGGDAWRGHATALFDLRAWWVLQQKHGYRHNRGP
jgi:hypothetical protein